MAFAMYKWPRGVGVVISPWNFPLAIRCGISCAAVLGGNTSFLKSSKKKPAIAAELVRLCIEAGFPPERFHRRATLAGIL